MRSVLTFVVAVSLAMGAEHAQAAQFAGRVGGRHVVVHTNPLPVVMHRLLPPNPGRHITIRQYQASQQGRPNNARR